MRGSRGGTGGPDPLAILDRIPWNSQNNQASIQIRMEFRKECFVNLNIWECDRKHTKHQYRRISDFVVQKPMRTRGFSAPIHDIFRDYKRFVCKRYIVSLSPSCFQSLKIVWIQKISEVLPNQIRGKNLGPNKHTGSEQELMSDFASDASKECNWAVTWDFQQSAKPQISLRICTVWSEPLLVACIFYEC